jgi:hypothetical protein
MELTNELKERFISLYWLQKVAVRHDGHGYKVGIHFDPADIEYLELRPLSSITEEEAKDYFEQNGKRPKYDMREFLTGHTCDQADWLRKKGIAIKYDGIPVKQWVEWGVVKLKTE